MADTPDLPALPSLAPFLDHLTSLLTSPFCPPSLFIHSPAQSPILLPALLRVIHASAPAVPAGNNKPTIEQLLPKLARVDLKDVHSVKAAFDRILGQLSGWDEAGAGGWGERNGGVEAWDGSMDGVKVLRRQRKRRLPAGGGRKAKRPRMDWGTDSEEDDNAEGEERQDGQQEEENEPEWQLEWDRSASSSSAKPLAPLRNTVESFQHSLRSIFAVSAPPAPSAAFALDPGAGLSAPLTAPARRFIVLNHGELLSELAGSGTATGAARETGVGLTFASTMYRLGQLTGLPITVIVISRLPWRKARESMVGLPSPELLVFDDLANSDAVTLLTTRYASSDLSRPSASDTLTREQLIELFSSLALVVRNTFGKSVTDLEDHAYLCAKFWPRWKEAVEKSNPPIAPTDTARLSIALKSDFAAELDRLALPRQSLSSVPLPSTSSAPVAQQATQLHGFTGTIAAPPKQPAYLAPVPPTPEKQGSASNIFVTAAASAQATPVRSTDPDDPFTASASASAAGPSTPLRQRALARTPSGSAATGLLFTPATAARQKQLATHAALSKSLPIAARFLLIAAYFAAVNPPKSDVRMFVRVDETEGVARKGKKARKQSAKKPGASPSKGSKPAALFGGKAFAYERLVAIFEAIVDDRREYCLGSVAIAGQVQSLLHLRLLTRASSESNTNRILDGVKLKCPLAKDVVDALAQSVGWKEWRERLVGEEP
ncbi:hypothetical protein JCM10213_004461 [Rhodosporidiobolus nylandii]